MPVWLLSVQQRQVALAIRERFSYVKAYLVSAVQQAFVQLTGLSEAPSNAVEDLRDFDRIDQAFTQLSTLTQRQDCLETSLDRARSACRDMQALIRELRERVQELEQQGGTRISPQQRGTLYHMVQHWSQARAGKETQLTQGVAIHKSWSELNARFSVSSYTDSSRSHGTRSTRTTRYT